MITAFVPKNGPTHVYSKEGRVFCSRINDDGRVVIDLRPDVFRSLLADRTMGLGWHDANPEALRQLALG